MPRVALVIDDSPVCSRMAVRLLERMDCRVFVAPTVEAARQAFRENRYQLVVSDVQLPDGDGVDLAKELLSQDSGLHIVIMSADPSSIERAREAGLSRCILKPFGFDELRGAISVG